MYTESMPMINPRSDFNFTAAMIASPEVARRSQGTSLRSFLASLRDVGRDWSERRVGILAHIVGAGGKSGLCELLTSRKRGGSRLL